MNILSLTPGTGGTFYCQNCLRDGQMVRALRRAGHDVTVVPLYLPIMLDAEGLQPKEGVFFGGVNVYLQQSLGLFRNTPRWLDKIFDSAWMLRKAATQEGSTSAAELGPMTYSMLQGRDGKQRKELDRLLEWLKEQPQPDVVHISNALLMGIAAELSRELKVPVVCSLQDEDYWVDAMVPPWRERCWNLIAEKARDVDLFVAVSDWYARRMEQAARIPRERIRTVHLGTEWKDVPVAPMDFDPPTIGYLSRLNHHQGFTALVDTFIALKKEPGLERLKLRATGGVTSGDHEYVDQMKAKLAAAGVLEDVDIVENFGKDARREFIRSVDVLCSPSVTGEAFGLFIIEAGACGVPVVEPDVGGFREVIEMTGGGVVYDPADPNALRESLKRVLLDPDHARALGQHARPIVQERFSSDAMAAKIGAVFEEAVARREGTKRGAASAAVAP